MAELTPYDTGERLEPQPWAVRERADYGKVDFDNDESATVATVWIESIDGRYHLMLDDHSGELVIQSGTMMPVGSTPSAAQRIADAVLAEGWPNSAPPPSREQVRDMLRRAIFQGTVTA